MVRCLRVKDLLSSSLWITVFVVRVGCFIEAHASTTVSTTVDHMTKDSKEDLSASLLRQSGVKKKVSPFRRLFASRHLSGSGSITRPTAAINNLQAEDSSSEEDSCASKADGYFPNYGSDCTSYYFCAAGYQITFVCPPGARFSQENKKCDIDVKCPSKGHKNICNYLPNGYYAKGVNSRKYFYCFNNAKVIDLQCDEGKVYRLNKCVVSNVNSESSDDHADLVNGSCENMANGFYTAVDSGCSKYYFCIGGAKTELTCQVGQVFNGEICVQVSQYKCPGPVPLSSNSISNFSGSNHADFSRQQYRGGVTTEAYESTTTQGPKNGGDA